MLATTAGQSVLNNNAFGLSKQKDVGVYLHIERGSEIDHKWSLQTHVGTHCNAKCEYTYLGLSARDWITQDRGYHQVCHTFKHLWRRSCSCEETAYLLRLGQSASSRVSTGVASENPQNCLIESMTFTFSPILHYPLKTNKNLVSNLKLQ